MERAGMTPNMDANEFDPEAVKAAGEDSSSTSPAAGTATTNADSDD
jgi:biotin synthase